jgi:hypothetical protein
MEREGGVCGVRGVWEMAEVVRVGKDGGFGGQWWIRRGRWGKKVVDSEDKLA